MAKKLITHKQHTILLLLYIFRFLNSKQIQEFMNHTDHRRINSWLKDLAKKGYIVRDYKPIYGQLTKPAVCYLTVKGRMYIKKSYTYYFPAYLKRISRDNKNSKAFRIRCQIIADWYLLRFPPQKNNIDIVNTLLTHLTTDTNEEKIPLNSVQFFTPADFPTFTLLGKIKPDAYLRKKTTKGVTHGLLFVLDSYISRLVLRYRLKSIFDILDEEYWEDESIAALHLYVLCPNNQIIIYLKRALPTQLEQFTGGKPLNFYLATRNQLYSNKNVSSENIQWVTLSSTDY